MKEISIQALYEFYLDTLNHCSLGLLEADDETVEHEIFEEFDIGAISFLHQDNLLKLYQSGYISEHKMNKSCELRDQMMELQKSDEWNMNSFRSSKKWRSILILSDEIKAIK